MKDYTFGNLIANLRMSRGYSQLQLGRLLDVSDKAISKWENGDAKPRLATCVKLAGILEVSVNELLSSMAKKSTESGMRPEAAMEHNYVLTRKDNSPAKRVELHLRTGFSKSDSLGDAAAYIHMAAAWGHQAIAITDYCSTQSFPYASKEAEKLGVKLIYGCELPMLPTDDSETSSSAPVMLLVRNRPGLINLNKLISHAYTKNLRDGIPYITRAQLLSHREGLLVGRSCNDKADIANDAELYDYFELSIPENAEQKAAAAKLFNFGKETDKLVVAVGDVHYPNPEDSLVREILLYNEGIKADASKRPCHYMTTDEMLPAFEFLGIENARKAVITNSNKIAALIDDKVSLLPDEQKSYLPVWKDAENEIAGIARDKAHALYGNNLPEAVENRLEAELAIINEHRYGALYSTVMKLTRRASEDGYSYFFRGCAEGSFVAWLCGITTNNPLPVHLYCRSCHYSKFGTSGAGNVCPVCGEVLTEQGLNLPYETFLGLHGEKTPDFAINIDEDYQERMCVNAKELFGAQHTFRAGIISHIPSETADRYIRRFCEDHDRSLTDDEKKSIVENLQTVVRYTGQHPGGVILVPEDMDINEFTPVQYPSNDTSSLFRVTHYDFSMLYNRLIKLDFLSHSTPQLLSRLQRKTGKDIASIPPDDRNVLSLFRSTEALGLEEGDLLCRVGTYGIPGFNTFELQKLLYKLQPQSINDLVAVLGLKHGTDVWDNNADRLFASGVANLSTFPAHREDIFNTLLEHGIEHDAAYRIMERVSKGKGLLPEMEDAMRKALIPDWYIEACKKIRYMFPRAHSVSYAVCALQTAWFKLYEPRAFYDAWIAEGMENTSYYKDAQLDCSGLRKAILNARSDESDIFCDGDREHSLELLLERKLRGIDPPTMSDFVTSMMEQLSPVYKQWTDSSVRDGKEFIDFIMSNFSKGIPDKDSLKQFDKNLDKVLEKVRKIKHHSD